MWDLGELSDVNSGICDIFGDNEKDWKIGNDFDQGDCTWPVVTAMGRASSSE